MGLNQNNPMLHIYIKDARIVDAPASSRSKFYVEHPQNDAIIASADTREEAEAFINRINVLARLEELRRELRAERISYGEIAELQALAPYIEPGDVELLEAAGVPEKQ